ncbi:MAG: hypothetical protein AAFR36_00220 [Bacteroidota bacterium]
MFTPGIIPVLLLLFLSCTTNDLFAQRVDREEGELWRYKARFYSGDQQIPRSFYEARLEEHPEAGPLYRSGKRTKAGGIAMVVVGGATIVVGGGVFFIGVIFDGLNGQNDVSRSGGIIALVGLGTTIGGGSLISSGKKKMRRATDIYNKDVVEIDRLGLQLGPDGIGLRLTIGR